MVRSVTSPRARAATGLREANGRTAPEDAKDTAKEGPNPGPDRLPPTPQRLQILPRGLAVRRCALPLHLPSRHASRNARRAGPLPEEPPRLLAIPSRKCARSRRPCRARPCFGPLGRRGPRRRRLGFSAWWLAYGARSPCGSSADPPGPGHPTGSGPSRTPDLARVRPPPESGRGVARGRVRRRRSAIAIAIWPHSAMWPPNGVAL